MRKKILFYVLVPFLIFTLNGCALILQKGRRSDMEKIESLEKELAELRRTRGVLEQRLAQEIENDQVSVRMGKRGLVITFVAEVLFDSGKAKLRDQAKFTLEKIAGILGEEVPENHIAVEGHTDNVPIKHSRWKSNWELSAHRALSVLSFLESVGIDSSKLSATGYGEFQPVGSNDDAGGKQLNRRVEIIIVPNSTYATQTDLDVEDLK
ncbi:MAG: OmpA family protein [Candidatus Omnitrophica bacterium]|nr:OmpA family protein [Candidatus Omnitrophota bacterium]